MIQANKQPNVINLTNHTPFLIFCSGCICFKVKEREKRGGGNTLLELHRALGRDMRWSTMIGAARCIESPPVMWCSTTGRCRRHRLKGPSTSQLFARSRHMPTTFFFNFIYANTKLPFTHTILMKKNMIKTPKHP